MKQIKRVLITLTIFTGLLLVGSMFLSTLLTRTSQDAAATLESADADSAISSTEETSVTPAIEDTPTIADTDETPSLLQPEEQETVSQVEKPEAIPPTEEAPAPFQEYDITLMAVGDNLMHTGIIKTGKQSDGTYDYSILFRGISEFLETADIKIINQETILGGNEKEFTGYPKFNSPTEVGDAIAAAGFNVVLQASNHSADQGLDGLLNCVRFWDTHPEVLMTGIYADSGQPKDIPLITIEDVTFAILNYTYSPNMEIIPEYLKGRLNFLCDYDDTTNRLDFTSLNPRVLEDIAEAEKLADIVIVCPHWGTEYTTKASRYQQAFALQMTAAGADLIIGTHPHVVQPVEWITAENGNRALCYYSLGNYVSLQKDNICMLEGMAWTTFHVTEDGITIDEQTTGILPLVCHYTKNFRVENVYLLEDYTVEQAAAHGIYAYDGIKLNLEDLQNWSREILGGWILSKDQVLTP